jgi:hypothetical protein
MALDDKFWLSTMALAWKFSLRIQKQAKGLRKDNA